MRPNMNGLGPAHVPFGGDTERALGLPASCQGGSGSVELLPAAERDMFDTE
jgi:hypothetical protein